MGKILNAWVATAFIATCVPAASQAKDKKVFSSLELQSMQSRDFEGDKQIVLAQL